MLPQEWPRAAREMAAKILAITGPVESMHLSTQNGRQQLNDAMAEARRELEKVFLDRAIRLVPAAEDVFEVALTMSENLQGPVWIAEIRRGDSRNVVMISLPRPAPSGENASPSAILQIRPVFQQELPILDLIRFEDELIVLDSQNISLYRWADGWKVLHTDALTGFPDSRPTPRDPRGRLIMRGSSLEVYFPHGLLKMSADFTGIVEMSRNGIWPWEPRDSKLVVGRNYFLAEGFPPFYSAVQLGSAAGSRRLVAGLDGKTRLYGPDGEVQATFEGWGSEIAAIAQPCGEGSQVLVPIPGENGFPDSIQAYRITDRGAVAISPPTQLPGTVTALWPQSGQAAATLVCHNPSAKRYEAFEITVTCSR